MEIDIYQMVIMEIHLNRKLGKGEIKRVKGQRGKRNFVKNEGERKDENEIGKKGNGKRF